ncbi:His/Glu/Gln/Arg/opine family amino acid ABC transporter permease subunit [Rhizobium tropici]|nr:His/Glu/Gln/Arg/opine family amino acid ABC transporter permease subunit [Rhizobium tropici]MBB6305686.1 His/Glu/Gln/Arg/opine family amino acid ABC transporter permease subunit [Rhizobium leucaenae]MBB6488175.1 His/Glu/Gln/Arg/opine family amino acid ABC transporter permease subunit [Rhizobium lusitanum]MBB5596197.1 His/Glu/Gln/Arg/opine family amino acid ABC transporter permease subunit [Rhizobium tropici]MBB6495226.1 His/Glu/Gln/Arg/opine family amino acid ABC transporter permease subunit
MTMKTGAPRQPFHLGMLFNDTRYRARTIQILAFILLLLAAAWLVDNTIRNLAALGKDFSFGFLWSTAGYDISPHAIDYSSTSTHARAAVVGLLNTLIVAAMACLTASILGVLAGVLRLSDNWIVARLMTVYVESFRNIPALLWIIVVAAVMSQAMPTPNAFRGEHPTAAIMLWDSIAVTNRGIYLPTPAFSQSLGPAPDVLGAFDLNYVAILTIVALSLIGHRGLVKARRAGPRQNRSAPGHVVEEPGRLCVADDNPPLRTRLPLRLSGLEGLELHRRSAVAQCLHRALDRAEPLYRRLHCGNRSFRHSCHFEGPV